MGKSNGINLRSKRQQYSSIKSSPKVIKVHFLKTTWFKYAAAILLIITGIALLLSIFSYPLNPETAVVQNVPPPWETMCNLDLIAQC